MPPEAAERVRRHCKYLGVWRRRYVQEVEDQVKLSYYFGGQTVVTLRSIEGPIIVAAGRAASEEFGRQLHVLAPEDRRQKCYCYPPLWNGPGSEPRILFRHEDPNSAGRA
jgi:hypothetical protein